MGEINIHKGSVKVVFNRKFALNSPTSALNKKKKKKERKKGGKLNSSDYVKDHLLLNVVPLYVSCVRFHFAFCSFEFENLHFFRFSSASV